MMIEHAQDAVGGSTFIAVIDSRTGRQVVNLQPGFIAPPLITLQSVGERWIDADGHEWERVTEWWYHAKGCVCMGERPFTGGGAR